MESPLRCACVIHQLVTGVNHHVVYSSKVTDVRRTSVDGDALCAVERESRSEPKGGRSVPHLLEAKLREVLLRHESTAARFQDRQGRQSART